MFFFLGLDKWIVRTLASILTVYKLAVSAFQVGRPNEWTERVRVPSR